MSSRHAAVLTVTAVLAACVIACPSAVAGPSARAAVGSYKLDVTGLSKTERARATAAVALLDGAFNRHDPATAAARYIDPTTYVQHNPDVANGRAAFVAYVSGYLALFPQASLTIRRVVTQGGTVVVHSLSRTSASDRGTVLLDIFRFNRRNRIVEHWDLLQAVRDTSKNGNPQV